MNYQICINGVSHHHQSNYQLIRFIDKGYLESSKNGSLLISSYKRNRELESSRGDSGEGQISVNLNNSENIPISFKGDEAKYIGMRPGKKIDTLTLTGNVTIEQADLINGNPLSLSFSALPKNLPIEDKLKAIAGIKSSLGLDENVGLLVVKDPKRLINEVTSKLKIHTKNRNHLHPISGNIIYQDRTINTFSKVEFVKKVEELFFSGILNLSYLFLKPKDRYENELEFRVFWLGGSGKSKGLPTPPFHFDYFEDSSVIIDGLNFDRHFKIYESPEDLS